jgi:protein-disulfide isomerase
MRARLFAVTALIAAFAASAQAQAPAPAPAPAKPAAAAPAPAPAAALPNKWDGPEYVIGNPNAKVTLVEYASAACPHCARFDAQVFPQLKAKYIDTGKVKYAFREMLVGDEAEVNVAAISFLMARCAGHDRYMDVVEQVFRAQQEIFQSQDVKSIFVRIAKANGLSEAQLDACLNDKSAVDALNARIDHAEKVDKVDSTPTLIANGKKLAQKPGQEWDFATLDAQLKPLVGGTSPAHRTTRRH